MRMIFEGDPKGKEELGNVGSHSDYATFERIVEEYKKQLHQRDDSEIRNS